MKTIYRKILGWFLATLLIPLILTFSIFIDDKYTGYSFWDKLGTAFILGYLFNIIIIIFIGFCVLIIWLIDSN